jgi:Na+/proline symporter
MSALARDFGYWVGGYIVLLLILGALARRARRADTLSDFYLAGRSMGFFVLLLTLFATQYSGNSLSGFPGQTYRRGLLYFMSVAFMVAIVAGYNLFAPRLFRLAREHRFVTPTDYLAHRYANSALSYLGATIFALTLFNFLLAQLMAMGHAAAGLSGGALPFHYGVLAGAAVILVYELMGGMRAVAWTDAVQGVILMIGIGLVIVLLWREVGSPAVIVGQVARIAPEKVANPTLRDCLLWFSNLLLLGLGAPLYPQAIQRIYAARRMKQLRRALGVMAFLPLGAITAVVLIGLAGIALFPGLSGTDADQITFKVLAYLVEAEPLAYLPVLLVMLAVVAAIMSTADSSLLSLSSILSKDFVARLRGLDEAETEGLTRLGALFSVGVMVLLCLLAIRPLTTLWGLLVIKFEILIQLSPAFVLGTLHERSDPRAFSGRSILAGLLAGLAVAMALHAAGMRSLYGLHAGVVGLALNYAIAWGDHRWRLRAA